MKAKITILEDVDKKSKEEFYVYGIYRNGKKICHGQVAGWFFASELADILSEEEKIEEVIISGKWVEENR